MDDPVAARIFQWERRAPAVDCTYANGERDAHQIGLADWPVLARLELAGKLTFKSDDLRRRYQAMKPALRQ
jgi:hypothetical protein